MTVFRLMGSVVFVITILAFMSTAVPELSDLSHPALVATEFGVIEAILLTMVVALISRKSYWLW